MTVSLPPSILRFLPIGVRLVLARLAVWRLRNGSALKPAVLTLGIVLLSGSIGYLAALQTHVGPMVKQNAISVSNPPVLGAAHALNSGEINRAIFPNASDWGLLHAELLRLRVLLKRIADLSDFNHGEFDLDFDILDQASLFLDERFVPEQSGAAVSTGAVSTAAVSTGATSRLALVKSEVSHMSQQSRLMLAIVEQQTRQRLQQISGLPVKEPTITSRFGYRRDPLFGRRQFHAGIDFAGTPDTKVMALAEGVVTYSGRNGNYGNLVELEHVGGYRSRYAHNSANLVALGSRVDKGDPIALMGSTGKSTGTHVHVEIHKAGKAVDPVSYLQ